MGRIGRVFLKVALFLPIILGVVVANYVCDPARLFTSKDLEKRMVLQFIHSSDQGAEFLNEPTNYDDRFFQRFYVDNIKDRKDVLVFGSSTTMHISADFFPGKKFFNAWVSGMVLNDQIAIYGLYRRKGLIPKMVVLGADTWIFDRHRAHVYRNWERLTDSYEYMLKEMGSSRSFVSINIADYVPSSWAALFSFSYFQSSMEMFLSNKGNLPSKNVGGYVLTRNRQEDRLVIWPDGSRVPSKNERERRQQDVEAQTYAAANGIDAEIRMDLEEERVKHFEEFLALLKNDGVSVIVYLPPQHPVFFEAMNGSLGKYAQRYGAGLFDRTEKIVREVAARQDARVIGSYNPQTAHVKKEQFFDGFHLRSAADVRPLFREAGF